MPILALGRITPICSNNTLIIVYVIRSGSFALEDYCRDKVGVGSGVIVDIFVEY